MTPPLATDTSGTDAHGVGSQSVDPGSVARLQAEVRALRLTVAGLAGELPETLAEQIQTGAGLDGFTGDLLVRSLADCAGQVAGEFLEPNPGTASTVLLALHYARDLPETSLIDAAVVAGRLANAAVAWQAEATAVLADRRQAVARQKLLTTIWEAEADPEQLQPPAGEGIGGGYTVDDLDDAIDLARRSAVAEVAMVSDVTEYRLGKHVTLLRDSFEDHPLVVAAVRTGRVDLIRAAVITEVTSAVPDPDRRDRIERPALAAAARGVTIPTLRRLLEQLLAQEAPDEHTAFTKHEHATRTGVKIKDAGYGLASMTVTADAALIKEAEAAVKTLTEMATTASDDEHLGQANPAHVVLEELINAARYGATLEGHPTASNGAKVQINLTVPLSTVFAQQAAKTADEPDGGGSACEPEPTDESGDSGCTPAPDAPAELTGFGWIPAALARELLHEYGARATWRCQYVDDDPGSPHHGTIVGVGRAAHDPHYAPNLSTRELIIARDRTCRFPGCHRPARSCDLDHLTPYPDGPTCSDQMISLCRHHHRLKHHGGFTPRKDGAAIVWTTPTGRQIRVEPHRHLPEQDPTPEPDPPPPF